MKVQPLGEIKDSRNYANNHLSIEYLARIFKSEALHQLTSPTGVSSWQCHQLRWLVKRGIAVIFWIFSNLIVRVRGVRMRFEHEFEYICIDRHVLNLCLKKDAMEMCRSKWIHMDGVCVCVCVLIINVYGYFFLFFV